MLATDLAFIALINQKHNECNLFKETQYRASLQNIDIQFFMYYALRDVK